MIQLNNKKNDTNATQHNSAVEKNKCYLVKGSKPLQKYKFYLDVKNHAVTNKLEQKIKNLGGTVEFFLVREVTHVISDREECTSPSTPSGASVLSNHAADSPNPEHHTPRAGNTRLKTRADAMLEKVRTKSVTAVRDPLKNARLWDIPIWTVNKVFSWLEKICSSLTVNKTKTAKQLAIKAPFIKFEPVARDARPVYKTIESWPLLDFESGPGKPAFSMKHKDKEETNDRMTRKGRNRVSVRGSIKETEEKLDKSVHGGYCEICHTEYRELQEHLRSELHQQFMRNDANFLTLDSLIGASANVEAFLRLNGGSAIKEGLRRSLRNGRSPNGKINGVDDYCGRLTRNRIHNTRYGSNQSALSPTGSDSGHHLRSKGQIWTTNNLLGTTADEEIYPTKPKESARQERKTNRISENDSKENETKSTKDSDNQQYEKETKCKSENEEKKLENNKSKKPIFKPKRISADERLVADNRTYYKVEVMTSKLRSSGLGNRDHEVTKRSQTPVPEEEPEETSLVVKFKRVRRSELSVLNDEAENFMFPRKEDSSMEGIDTDECPNTTCSTTKNDTIDISSDIEIKTPKTFKEEPVEDSVEDFLDSLTLKDRFKCELDVLKKKKQEKEKKEIESDDQTTNEDIPLKKIITKSAEPETTIPKILETPFRALRKQRYPESTRKSLRTSKRNSKTSTDLFHSLDESAQDGSVMDTKRKKIDNLGSLEDLEMSNGTSRDSVAVSVCDSEGRKKKRRTQAEAFIEDNMKYFKFETPGSRLRYQGTLFSSGCKSPMRNNGEQQESKEECRQLEGEEKDQCETERPKFSLDDIKFSFEIEPFSEPWYQTFLRQDKGEEIYTSISEPGYQTRLILPYQIPASLIPLDPNVCISQYDQIKNLILNPSDAPSSPIPIPEEETSNSDQASILERRKKRKARFLLKANHPRKSPRQHASTLAILSSLIHQRKRRDKKGESERSSLGVITEEDTEISHCEIENRLEETEDMMAASQLISEILSAPLDDIDISSDPEGIYVKDKPDAIELLQNYDNIERDMHQTPGLSESTRTIRRKRKKNRTGWPKKKKLFPRRSGVKVVEEDTGCEPEDSRLTEGSEECSEFRTLNENQDSVDSNCNLENKCVKNDSVIKTKSEIQNMLNDSSEDIYIYNLKQGEIIESQKTEEINNSVNVDLNTWENAEKVLHAKVTDNDANNKILKYQPFVRVQKLDSKIANRRLRSSSSPERKPRKKQKVNPPASPRSPRKLRNPRGKWYYER